MKREIIKACVIFVAFIAINLLLKLLPFYPHHNANTRMIIGAATMSFCIVLFEKLFKIKTDD